MLSVMKRQVNEHLCVGCLNRIAGEKSPLHSHSRSEYFRQHWFEHSIPEFGESQGMLACGFVMLDIVDPSRQTDVVRGYSYRQIITRPILGGGFMTALAVPLIDRIGLPAFTIATAAVAGALIALGIKRVGRQG